MSAITVGEDLVHYEVLGRGRPVLLVHGWLGSWRYWIPIMRQLQLKYRVYAIDLFGFGDSGKNPERYAVSQQVNLVNAFMKELGIPKAAVIAHGLGALVITEFARRFPEKVARMLLVSAPLFDPGDLETRNPPGRRVLLTPNSGPPARDATLLSSSQRDTVPNPNVIDRDRLRQAAMERGRLALQSNEPTRSAPSPSRAANGMNPLQGVFTESVEVLLGRCFKRTDAEYDKLLADMNKADARALANTAVDFDAGTVLDILRSLPVPAVIVHGENDPLIPAPPESVWHYLTGGKDDLLPIPLPGVRHFPMLEHEPFNRLVTTFLETPDVSQIEVKERWRRRSR